MSAEKQRRLSPSPDRALFEAAAEAERLFSEWRAAYEREDSKEEELLRHASLPWFQFIADTPATTIEGALLKLKLLADELASGTSERQLPMLNDAIRVIESEMTLEL